MLRRALTIRARRRLTFSVSSTMSEPIQIPS
jgi:hypothetical protein